MSRPLLSLIALCLLLAVAGCRNDDENFRPDGPDGSYSGPHKVITLGMEADGLTARRFTLGIKAADGTVFERSVVHERSSDISTLRLDSGLAEGIYRLLYARYDSGDDDGTYSEFGFGSRVSIDASGVSVIDSFDPVMHFAGRGTSSDPYIISSSSHLFNLMMAVNDYDSNKAITTSTCFRQECDIDMKQMSRSCDVQYGWMPIGADTNTPFRGTYLGQGHKVTNLMADRPHTAGVGLFGFVCDASVDGLVMSGCSLNGQFAVGAVAGAVVTSGGGSRGQGTFTNCSVRGCSISGPSTSAAVGGILGGTDMHSRTLLAGCVSDGNELTGGMNIGGITGGAGIYSSVMISDCTNSSTISSDFSGAGGMVGTADTLQIAGCTNTGEIKGSLRADRDNPGIGSGGLAGGSGMSWITGSVNHGKVSGREGVGGIIGSTRVKGSDSDSFLYNQSVLRYCGNTGEVTGRTFVGGAIGEAQAGAYAVYNQGTVSGTDYVGGVCGAASVAVIHNAVNSGPVHASAYASGILGKCTWGSLAICQNMSDVSGSSGHTAGVVALAGNNTVVNYCANFGTVTGPSSKPVGGIAAEIGDPRKWTGLNIAECVIGSMEIIMSVAGPVLAVVEEAVEFAHAAEVVIKIVETSTELALQGADYALLGYGIYEMVGPETEEELRAEMRASAGEASAEVMSAMSALRRKTPGAFPTFPGATLSTAYADNIDGIVAYYANEGNDEIFNESINEAREARAEKLEKIHRAQEIVHTVIGGVAVVCSTVALIGGTVASGGAATAFLVMGSAAALVGGANAIEKTCAEFEANAVVVSQCVNAGAVTSPGNSRASSIVGRLCDGSLVTDCLNTATVNSHDYECFAGDFGSWCDLYRCISLVPVKHPENTVYAVNSIFCDPAMSPGHVSDHSNGIYVAAPDRLTDKSLYSKCGFDLTSSWSIPEGYSFPVPYKSQMQK